MPNAFKSQAQHRLVEAAAHARPGKGRKMRIDPETARKMLADSAGQDIKSLPDHVKDKG